MVMRIVIGAALAAFACGAAAQDKPCSKAESGRAEKAVERVNNWPQMQKAYADYRHCDTGTVSDLYTETFVRLLVEWKGVDALVAATADPAFKSFMEKHLKDPGAKDDLQTILSRVKTACPAKNAEFCAQLAEFIKAADK